MLWFDWVKILNYYRMIDDWITYLVKIVPNQMMHHQFIQEWFRTFWPTDMLSIAGTVSDMLNFWKSLSNEEHLATAYLQLSKNVGLNSEFSGDKYQNFKIEEKKLRHFRVSPLFVIWISRWICKPIYKTI